MMPELKTRFLLVVVLVLGVAGGRSAAQSASALPIDSTAVFKTIVPARSAVAARPVASGQTQGDEKSAALAVFSGSPYAVGAVITPTSTVPEAEEHISVD